MKLAFSTNAYTRFPLTTALEAIARAGFSAVEILADVPHAWPDTFSASDVSKTVETLNRLKLTVSNINANCSFGYWKDAPPEAYFEPSLISPNPNHRADRTRLIFKTLEFAKQVGAKNISITSGRCLGGMPPHLAGPQFMESIKPILDRAESLGINVGIECEPGLFLEYATELRSVIDRLGHARLGANLDVGHSHVIGESIPEVLDVLQGRIWNLHIEDLPGRKHYHTIPGEGNFDWSSLVANLRRAAYDGFATVELYTETTNPQSAAEKSWKFLSPLFDS